jgi:hypothetical protein
VPALDTTRSVGTFLQKNKSLSLSANPQTAKHPVLRRIITKMVQLYQDPVLQQLHDSIFHSLPKPKQVLPPGLDDATFRKVLEEFVTIVGASNVASSEADVVNFKDPYPFDDDAHQPSAAL